MDTKTGFRPSQTGGPQMTDATTKAGALLVGEVRALPGGAGQKGET